MAGIIQCRWQPTESMFTLALIFSVFPVGSVPANSIMYLPGNTCSAPVSTLGACRSAGAQLFGVTSVSNLINPSDQNNYPAGCSTYFSGDALFVVYNPDPGIGFSSVYTGVCGDLSLGTFRSGFSSGSCPSYVGADSRALATLATQSQCDAASRFLRGVSSKFVRNIGAPSGCIESQGTIYFNSFLLGEYFVPSFFEIDQTYYPSYWYGLGVTNVGSSQVYTSNMNYRICVADSAYTIAPRGTATSGALCFFPITTAAECAIAAARSGFDYGGDGSWPTQPPGCFRSTTSGSTNGMILFNLLSQHDIKCSSQNFCLCQTGKSCAAGQTATGISCSSCAAGSYSTGALVSPAFVISSGVGCVVSGTTATSINFPKPYGRKQACTLTTAVAGWIQVEAFDLGRGDVLTVNGKLFTGSNLALSPDGLPVGQGSTITWSSDFNSDSAVGWKLEFLMSCSSCRAGTYSPVRVIYLHLC